MISIRQTASKREAGKLKVASVMQVALELMSMSREQKVGAFDLTYRLSNMFEQMLKEFSGEASNVPCRR